MEDNKKDKPYAHREKAYIQGTMFPFIKVGMQKVNLTPTVTTVNGEKITTPNAPVYIYDTSGPFSDPDVKIDLKKGLPHMVKAGLQVVEMWSNCLLLLPNMVRCAEMTRVWIICVLSILHCLIGLNREKRLHKWRMPKRVL